MPTYNGAQYLKQTLESLLSQNHSDFEIIICDDNSTDNTLEIVKSFNDVRIKIFAFDKNIGYPGNLNRCLEKASGEIIFLMGQDDVLLSNGIFKKVMELFEEHPDVGALTRPYYWFDKEVNTPVRIKTGLDLDNDKIVNITDDYKKIIRVFDSLDQLSGLALRRKFISRNFHPDIFPSHIYPWAEIFKNHPIMFLKDYTVAVRIASSQSRNLSSVYNKSPLQSWVEMFTSVFSEDKFENLRQWMIKNFVAKNYIGLVQIKNYAANQKYLWREIWLLVKYRPQNLYNLKFWFFSLGCLLTPRKILRSLVDWYKNRINSKLISILSS